MKKFFLCLISLSSCLLITDFNKKLVCGDGLITEDLGEVCDDGNTIDTDNCTSECQFATCGDGFVLNEAETCDDQNQVNTDACTNACEVAFCGDGIVFNQGGGTEICDDGNQVNGDGCDNDCTN